METAILTPNLTASAQQDYALVQAAIGGNQQAYASLMSRHQKSVYYQVLKLVKNRSEADDLTIEAFEKAFQHLSSYAPMSAFGTWLSRIATNNCIDHSRKKKIPFLSLDASIDESKANNFSATLTDSNRNPEEEIIYSQRIQLVRDLMEKLNGNYRQTLRLRFYEDLSYEEIAQRLNIPIGTVKINLFRGKKMMYELIQEPDAAVHFDSVKQWK
ncbi:MAG: RNA polymerase sigma factor (sigma-70 family) [Paraglaciecola sp.]